VTDHRHASPVLAAEMRRWSNPASAWTLHHVFERGESKVLKRIALGLISLWCLITFAAINTLADDLFIYPARGQSAEQQERDKWECRAWATRQTGFDPAARPTISSLPPARQAPQGGLVSGAAGGAALGAVGGAIGGRAGTGAAIGAATGGLLGTMRRNNQVRQEQFAQQQWAQQNIAQHEQNRSNWVRSVRACLTGRGYTVH